MKKITILLILVCGLHASANNWLTSFEDAKKLSISTNRLILVDFTAVWCGPCQKMEREVWADSEIQSLLNPYILLKVDLDLASEIKRKYAVNAIPLILIIDANGEILYKQLGSQNKVAVTRFLTNYAVNTSFLQRETYDFYRHKSYVTAMRLSKKYIDYSLYLEEDVESDFLGLAYNYLQISEKMLDKDQANYEMMKEKIGLMELNIDLYLERYNKVKRKLEDYSYNEVNKTNKGLFDYLNYCVCLKENNETAAVWKQKLANDGNDDLYLKKSEKLFAAE